MASTWYSKKLLTDTDGQLDGLVVSFVRPLVRELDASGSEYRFHFFRYSGPHPFLRLRIRGDEQVMRAVEMYEADNLGQLGSWSEPDPYSAELEIANGFRDVGEVEKAWTLYELGSRVAMETAANGFTIGRLREADYEIGVRLSHLFLNSMGYHTIDEFNIHLVAVDERARTALTSKQGGAIAVQRIRELLKQATEAFSAGWRSGPK